MTPPELVEKVGSFRTVTHGGHQFPTSLVTHCFPLDTLIVSQLGRFVKRFLPLFGLRRGSSHYSSGWSYLLLTLIYYHIQKQIARWNNVQNREKIFVHFYRVFLLTNCWGYVIMEIPRVWGVDARAGKSVKKSPQKYGAISNYSTLIQLSFGSFQGLALFTD